jgi:hypothetical protein
MSWKSTTLQQCGVRVYSAIYNKNLGLSRIYVFPSCVRFSSIIVPWAFPRGKDVVDSMIVSNHLDFVSCTLGHSVCYVVF